MEWLANNWLWILLGIGFFWFMSRGHGGMGGHGGGGHSHGGDTENPEQEGQQKPKRRRGCCG
jgi:hypothetical protein